MGSRLSDIISPQLNDQRSVCILFVKKPRSRGETRRSKSTSYYEQVISWARLLPRLRARAERLAFAKSLFCRRSGSCACSYTTRSNFLRPSALSRTRSGPMPGWEARPHVRHSNTHGDNGGGQHRHHHHDQRRDGSGGVLSDGADAACDQGAWIIRQTDGTFPAYLVRTCGVCRRGGGGGEGEGASPVSSPSCC